MTTAVFLVLPTVCLLFGNKRKHKGLWLLLVFVAFFLLIICTRNGADYDNYKIMYETIQGGNIFDHGELGFQYLMLFTNKLGLGYDGFRIIFITICSICVFVICYKKSNAPILSIFLLICGYCSYVISALRQYAVMVLFLFAFYEAIKSIQKKRNYIKPLIIILFGLFFHIPCTVFCIAILLFCFFFANRGAYRIKNRWFLLLALAFVIRLLFYFLSDTLIHYFGNFIGSYVEYSSLISFGLISRIAEFIVLTLLLNLYTEENRFTYYLLAISLLFYIAIPYDLFVGRLVNATKIIDIIVLANLCAKPKNLFVINKRSICTWVILILFVSTFVFQIATSSGYESYKSIF